jgi:hypothetical protein
MLRAKNQPRYDSLKTQSPFQHVLGPTARPPSHGAEERTAPKLTKPKSHRLSPTAQRKRKSRWPEPSANLPPPVGYTASCATAGRTAGGRRPQDSRGHGWLQRRADESGAAHGSVPTKGSGKKLSCSRPQPPPETPRGVATSPFRWNATEECQGPSELLLLFARKICLVLRSLLRMCPARFARPMGRLHTRPRTYGRLPRRVGAVSLISRRVSRKRDQDEVGNAQARGLGRWHPVWWPARRTRGPRDPASRESVLLLACAPPPPLLGMRMLMVKILHE